MKPDFTKLVPRTRFLAAGGPADEGDLVIFGCPFDGTSSFRPGSRFGPIAIREASDGLETYCPVLRRDLEEVRFIDGGDLPLPPGDSESAMAAIYDMAAQIHAHGQIPAALGGEHLITLPLVRAAAEAHKQMVVVQFDAHMDLRNSYLGVHLSHATVMRRIRDCVSPSHILQVGQRSGTREEFQLAETSGNQRSADADVDDIRRWVGDRPLYVTVDVDVLDPSVVPGTGTPEPGGVSFERLEAWLVGLAACNWIGWDIVELTPALDPSSVSSVVSAKLARTMVLASTASLC